MLSSSDCYCKSVYVEMKKYKYTKIYYNHSYNYKNIITIAITKIWLMVLMVTLTTSSY